MTTSSTRLLNRAIHLSTALYVMRPQKGPLSGNCGFRNSGISNYSRQLGTLGIGHMVSFSTYHETIICNGQAIRPRKDCRPIPNNGSGVVFEIWGI